MPRLGMRSLISINVGAAALSYPGQMETGQHDLAYYFAKASEYRMKAAAEAEEERQRALAFVALKFVHLAREKLYAPDAGSMH